MNDYESKVIQTKKLVDSAYNTEFDPRRNNPLHEQLLGRDETNQHPASAITAGEGGLVDLSNYYNKPQVNSMFSLRDEQISSLNDNTLSLSSAITSLQGQVNRQNITKLNYNTSTHELSLTRGDGSLLIKPLPMASGTTDGLMPMGSYSQLNKNTSDIASLMANGSWRATYPSYAAMLAAHPGLDVSSSGWAINDYVFVEKDETKNDQETSYVVDANKKLQFRRLETITISTATNSELGIVKGSNTNGQIFVESDGSMSLVGYDTLTSGISNNTADISKINNATYSFAGQNRSLAQILSWINNALYAGTQELGNILTGSITSTGLVQSSVGFNVTE